MGEDVSVLLGFLKSGSEEVCDAIRKGVKGSG